MKNLLSSSIISEVKTILSTAVYAIVLLFLLWVVGHYFYKWIRDRHKPKKSTFVLDEISLISIAKFKRTEDTPETKLAWKVLMELLSCVLSNTFDHYGSEKDVLASIYKFFQKSKGYLLENIAPHCSGMVLSLLNKEIRPFLAKWDYLINDKKVLDRIDSGETKNYTQEFKDDYERLLSQIENGEYKQRLAKICNLKISLRNHTDKAVDTLRLPPRL